MDFEGQGGDYSERTVQLPSGQGLYVRLAGSAHRFGSAPVIVLIHGLGGTAREWPAVQRQVARFACVVLPERAGYHRSAPPIAPPTPEAIACDLRALLHAAELHPPYLLVGHSYGGVLVSQFLRGYPDTVAGMVLIDSVPVVRRVPPVFTKLMGDATYEQLTGLEDNIGIDRAEYQAILTETAGNERPGAIAEQELQLMSPANEELRDYLFAQETILGQRPLNVIFCDESNDFKKIYEYGVKHGYGTNEEQEAVRQHLETMSALDEAAQREQLTLSLNARFVKTDGARATHNVHMVDLEWVAGEIKWAFDQAKASCSADAEISS